MATIAAVRTALKDRLATIADIRVYERMPDSLVPPAIVVRPLSGIFRATHGNTPMTTFELVLLIALGGLDIAQQALDVYLQDTGTSSIYATIRTDQTLGGVAKGTIIRGWRDYGSVMVNGVEYLGARVDVEVIH